MDAHALAVASLDDIVFEHRHKTYGAYDLRIKNRRTTWKSFWIGLTIFGSMIAIPLLASRNIFGDKEKTYVIHDFTPPPLEPEKPIEQLPPPEQPPVQEQVEQIAYVEPVPMPDQLVTEETPPPTDAEMKDAAISTVTVEGTPDTGLIAETPPETSTPTITEVIADVKDDEENKVHLTVEQSAEFPGGVKAMYAFLRDNLNYPSAAMRSGIGGKVYLQFVVNTDGSIVDLGLVKGVGFGCDEEAQRVIKLMPKWTPGRQNGRNVRQRYTLPIVFELN